MTIVPEPHVKWANRDPMSGPQKIAAFLGVGTLLLNVVVCCMIFTSKNGYLSLGLECKSGYVEHSIFCITEDLHQEFIDCAPSQWDLSSWGRRLALEDFSEHAHWDILESEPGDSPMLQAPPRFLNDDVHANNMWDNLAAHPEIPAVMIVLVIVVGCGWIMLLQKCAKPVVWAAIGLCVLILVFLALFPTLQTFELCDMVGPEDWRIINDDGKEMCTFLGGTIKDEKGKFMVAMLPPAVIIVVAAFFLRKKIDVAAFCLSKACLCLQQTCSIFGVAGLCFLATGCFQAIWLAAMVESGNIFEFNELCILEPKASTDTLRKILSITYLPTIFWMEYWLLVVVAAGVGGWYFKQAPDIPSNPAMQGFKWALGPSSGICFVAGCVTALVEAARRFTQKKMMCYAFPLWFTCVMLWYCCLRQLIIFTRYMVVSHTFHGGCTRQVANNAFAVLRKHIGGAVVTDTIAHLVMRMGVLMFSGGLAFGSWAWMEDAVGAGFLSDAMTGLGGNPALIIVLILVVLAMLTYPRFWLCMLAIIGKMIKYDPIQGWLTGMFVGCVAFILFSYIAQIVNFAMDAIFYCFALEAEFEIQNTNPDVQAMTQMVKDHVVKPVPEEYKNMVIEGVPADSAAVQAPVQAPVQAQEAPAPGAPGAEPTT